MKNKLFDPMKEKLEIETLKYAAGRQIFCPSCHVILDYRDSVLWTSPAARTGINCSACWQHGLDKIHDNEPEKYLLSIGWTIERYSKPKAEKPKKSASSLPKTRSGLNTWLRKDIARQFKSHGYHAKQDRLFPVGYSAVPMVETVGDDGAVDICYSGNPNYSPLQVSEYIRKFCELNHLTGA